MKYIVSTIIALNILDATATLYLINRYQVEEANPLMKFFLNVHPLAFILVKGVLCGAGVYLLWMLREHRIARIGEATVASIYFIVAIYHAVMLYYLV